MKPPSNLLSANLATEHQVAAVGKPASSSWQIVVTAPIGSHCQRWAVGTLSTVGNGSRTWKKMYRRSRYSVLF